MLTGVSGAGKTTVGRRLAERTGAAFAEGDDFHPPANVEKMRSGTPLTDADREPWLAALAEQIDAWRAAGQAGLMTCSALKRAYRERLARGRPEVVLVLLEVGREELEARLRRRRDHYMPPALLDSQLATLEPPGPDERVLRVEASGTPQEVVERVLHRLQPGARRS